MDDSVFTNQILISVTEHLQHLFVEKLFDREKECE